MVSSTWFSAESNLEKDKKQKHKETIEETEKDSFSLVFLLVNMKLQDVQLLLLGSRDHLLDFAQLFGLCPAGLQRRQNGFDSLRFLQEAPENRHESNQPQ